uniref:AlNc14C1G12 protein n=1 Tax=Albugo laibachii Nc14 TaxID=890382 RepID=F0VYK5_9STRA|nr:AlNc14C1G12 [Albugo laibachii Nc14]|eukprot:CCA13869.1 AlNc14C1G12 [Albugo laibachii Nc14]
MSALELEDLGVVNKLLGLRNWLDEEVEYILHQEVSIDTHLKEYVLETSNGVRARIVEECNDCNSQETKYLPVTAANGNASVEEFQSLVGGYFVPCIVWDDIYVLRYTGQVDKRTSLKRTTEKWRSEFQGT